ncbi:hypothetical protein Cpir12675_004926 [Ceratocystis pirilliformis]|uniref:RING-type domain-containing protein n=1 Tax=Ceratocystis pirilliformis TaxID=259994 RepID=A0ABR3YUB2_9PEZI
MTSTPAGTKPTLSVSSHPPPPQSGPSTSNPVPNRSTITPAIAQPSARRNQSMRRQHRSARRPTGDRYDEDYFAEIKALGNTHGRRGQTSITHLLNYAAPPRLNYDHTAYARSYRRQPAWGSGSGYHAADKARYVHANYRFIVAPVSSYNSQATNSDVQIEWGHVFQVIASGISQLSSCPVCLSEPVAPRMAKCGHIFCLSCVMRYMATLTVEEEEELRKRPNRQVRWKKCPICDDHVYIHDMRPVRFYSGQETALPRPGDDVILRLMARTANYTLALPKGSSAESLHTGTEIPWHFAANVLDYARIMKGTIEYMEEQHDEEIIALEEMEKSDELMYGEDNEWTQKAIHSIQQSKTKLQDLVVPSDAGLLSPVDANESASTSKQHPNTPEFYFYSAPPHLYLSPLDIRILKTKYGSFSEFPSTLLPRVEHISTGHAVDDALRKRAKYLNHLPHGCLISFLECDWTDIIPADTLAQFADEIRRRRKRNADKSAQEDRLKAQAERRETAAMQRFSSTMAGVTNGRYGHVYNPYMDDPTHQIDSPVDLDADFQALPGTSPPGSTTSSSLAQPESSDHDAASSMEPSSKTVWGTQAIAGDQASRATADVVDDGWLRDEDLLGRELALQLQQIQMSEARETADEALGMNTETIITNNDKGSGAGGKKKRKQKQKITLMSTGSRRAM